MGRSSHNRFVNQRILKVHFPYCTEEEMSLMNEALNSAFNDIQTNATLKKSLDVYKATHKKVL